MQSAALFLPTKQKRMIFKGKTAWNGEVVQLHKLTKAANHMLFETMQGKKQKRGHKLQVKKEYANYAIRKNVFQRETT